VLGRHCGGQRRVSGLTANPDARVRPTFFGRGGGPVILGRLGIYGASTCCATGAAQHTAGRHGSDELIRLGRSTGAQRRRWTAPSKATRPAAFTDESGEVTGRGPPRAAPVRSTTSSPTPNRPPPPALTFMPPPATTPSRHGMWPSGAKYCVSPPDGLGVRPAPPPAARSAPHPLVRATCACDMDFDAGPREFRGTTRSTMEPAVRASLEHGFR